MPDPLPWSEVLISYESHPTRHIQRPNGKLMPDLIFNVTPAAKDRLRAGYMCCNCLGQFPESWPLRCPDCQFPVHEEQGWIMQQNMYTDYGIVTPGIPLDREREFMARNAHVPKVKMVVPRNVKR